MRIGVDVGGTKIEAIALDEHGATLGRERVATPQGDYEATVAAIAGLVARLEAAAGRRGTVGVGTPGAVSPATGLMKTANSVCMNGRPLAEDLARALGRPVRVANDANCFALSEASDGAAAGAEVVFGVIVGTGTGGGLVVHGRPVTGVNALAGEWGHNPLPWPTAEEWPGPPCFCGKTGCVERFLSGPGLREDHQRVTGAALEPREIVTRAAAGEAAARATMERYAERMAKALAALIHVVDPDVIVLGGGMSNVAWLYDEVPRRWGRWVFSDRLDTALRPPLHGDASGVRGAAWLWPAG